MVAGRWFFKWIWITPFILLIYGAGNYALRYQVIMPRFAALEAEEANKDLTRCIDALEREAHHLETLSGDWAIWDDTYQFVQDGNQAYIDSNLQWSTLEKASGINLIYIVNPDRDVVWGELYAASRGGNLDIPEELQNLSFLKDADFFGPTSHQGKRTGLLLTAKGPLLISAQAIVRSTGQGPVKGIFIMGRFLSQEMLKILVEQTRVNFTIQTIVPQTVTTDADHIHALLKQIDQEGSHIEIIDDQRLAIYGVFNDIEGKPGLLIKAQLPRYIMSKGRSAAWFASVSVLVTITLMGFFLALMLAGYIVTTRRRTAEIEALVVQRTRELKASMKDAERAQAEAESANQAKSQFLANMSHEIRTPLNGILGMTEIAQNQTLDPKLQGLLATIVHEARLLLDILNDILDLSKIEAHRLELEKMPFALDEMLAMANKSIAFQASRKGLSFSCDIAEEVPKRLVGDPLRLKQILLNLAGNALKFTSQGGIKIRVALVERQHSKAVLKFFVEDTGIGIPAEKLGVIFQSFTQADGSTTRKFGGTGLGTTIAKQLAKLMEGEIGAESTVGEGSLFWFTVSLRIQTGETDSASHPAGSLPVIDEQPGVPAAGERTSPPVSDIHILVAEDYPTNQEVILFHLRTAGFKVDLVANGQEAVDAFQDKKYDLILMDVQMPVMDGIEACGHIREIEAARNSGGRLSPGEETPFTPIIALSAHAFKKDYEKCIQAGMDDYLAKPFTRQQVLRIVYKWITPFKKGKPDNFQDPAVEVGPEPTHPQAGEQNEGAGEQNEAPLDVKAALDEFLGRNDLFEKALHHFMDECTLQIKAMHRDSKMADLAAIRAEAHKIKGAAANLTMYALSRSASRLEEHCFKGQPAGCQELINDLETALTRVKLYLVCLKGQ